MTKMIYTLGHSTLSIEGFLTILRAYAIEMLVDVRRFPRSRRNPQFNDDALRRTLEENGIEYRHMEGLGGRRSTSASSINLGWENESFRGYADYMQTAEFEDNIRQLIETAARQATAIMCAEAVPWRCHRSLIGDALLVRGFVVIDILSEKDSRLHSLPPWASVEGQRITYPKGA